MKKKIDQLLAKTPDLMAKDIAKVLGKTRAEVNSFLYKNQDRYEQDSKFRWRLAHAVPVTLTLPTGWVTGDAFETILQEAGDILNGSCSKIEFVFSSKCKTMIDCIARLLALMNQLAHAGKHVRPEPRFSPERI